MDEIKGLNRDQINTLLRLIHYRLPYADDSEFDTLSDLRRWIVDYRKAVGL